MEFFTQLLDSYSKLKKRALRLVESGNPQALAQAAIKKAEAGKASFSKANGNGPFQLTRADGLVNADVLFVFPTKNGWKYTAKLNADGGPTFQHPVTDGKFEGYFDQGASVEQPKGKKFEKTPAGTQIAGSELALEMGDDITPIVEAFQEMALISPEVFAGIDPKYLKNSNWETLAAFQTYIFGLRRGSLESQVLNDKMAIDYDGNSRQYITSVLPASFKKLKHVVENIKSLMSFLAKDNLSEDDKNRLNDCAAINLDSDVKQEQSVTIFGEDTGSGLVFKDESGFLKMLMSALQKKHEIKVKKLKIEKKISTGLDNNIRGVALEQVLPMFNMQRVMLEMKAKGMKGAGVLEKGVKESFKAIQDKIAFLRNNFQSWVAQWAESAQDTDVKDIIDSVGALVGSKGDGLITALAAASKQSIAIRKPDFIVTKGLETGNGIRHDTFEIFTDPSKSKAALLRSGFTEEDISSKGMIKSGFPEQVFAGREDLLAIAYKSGVLRKGQQIFYNSYSLKNYIDLDEAVFGKTTVNSNLDFINGTTEGNPTADQFFSKARETIGVTPEDHEKVVDYNKSLHDIGGKIRMLDPARAKSSSTGVRVRIDPFASFIDSAMDAIKSNSDYSELHSDDIKDTSKKEFIDAIERFKKAADKDDEDLKNKIKQYAATYLKNKKIISDISKGSKAAKQYLMMKLFNTGGCVDDGLACDYRGLGSKENYNLIQNDIVKDVVKSFMSGNGDWALSAKGNYFIFTSSKYPNAKLTLFDKVEKKNSTGGTVYSTGSTCSINRATMQAFNRMKKSVQENIIDSLYESQKLLLDQLMLFKEAKIWAIQ
jgi:hypothetical protein